MYKYATTVIIPNIKLDTFSLDNNQTFIIPITEAKISIILEFIENPTAFKLTIVIHDTLTDAQKNLVKQKVAQDFPLHLSVEIQYS